MVRVMMEWHTCGAFGKAGAKRLGNQLDYIMQASYKSVSLTLIETQEHLWGAEIAARDGVGCHAHQE